MNVINVDAGLQIFPVRIIPFYLQEFDLQIVFDSFQKYLSPETGDPDDVILGLVYGMGRFHQFHVMVISKIERKIQEFALIPTLTSGEFPLD